jgi:hypothetical protein
VEVGYRSLVTVLRIWERKEKRRGPFVKGFLSHTLMLFVGIGSDAPLCSPQIKPRDLPTFEPLESCSLRYCAKSRRRASKFAKGIG